MAYTRRTWTNGEVIDAEKLNNIETGITEAKKEAQASGITAGTLGGQINANVTAMANASTAQIRDIVIMETDPGESASVAFPDGTVIFAP